ncbi:helix-turn-helix domain-containing protein [Anaeromicropila herbilytica]|uniref:HTH cro/C1-type domain-containing protein n=1 Tax=Anaeromicropila herbilytica TaxID=2785025 RepID=A0A7R7EIK9_9FIRM|nr:helix-turn-helix domain-containing protein [Anaeromicropila herbilytica]BCN29117.1 hypothetical protein bsdtb5_04120 [Anaeromicropila herbilytica]
MKMEIGNIIYGLRKSKKLTQEQLAIEIGVSTAAVSKWETDNSIPDIAILCSLADFFEVSVDDMLGRTDMMESHGKIRAQSYDEKVAMLDIARYLLELKTVSEFLKGDELQREIIKKHYEDQHLNFAVEFMIKAYQMKLDSDEVYEILMNYSKNLNRNENIKFRMIAKGIYCIMEKKSAYYTEEVLCSYLGYDMRKMFYECCKDERYETLITKQEIRYKYMKQTCYSKNTDLLEFFVKIENRMIQLILRNLDQDTLVNALKGVSGDVLLRFMDNLSEKMIFYIAKDLELWNGTEADILEAERNVLQIYQRINSSLAEEK